MRVSVDDDGCVWLFVVLVAVSCNTNCRAACNYRGTICGAHPTTNVTANSSHPTVTSVITLATCQCDDGYTGSQCGTLSLPPPAPNHKGEYCSTLTVPLSSGDR